VQILSPVLGAGGHAVLVEKIFRELLVNRCWGCLSQSVSNADASTEASARDLSSPRNLWWTSILRCAFAVSSQTSSSGSARRRCISFWSLDISKTAPKS
jgi:hypothetical protein